MERFSLPWKFVSRVVNKILYNIVTNYYKVKGPIGASTNQHKDLGFLERAAKNLSLNRE
jgi:hypothetical protein